MAETDSGNDSHSIKVYGFLVDPAVGDLSPFCTKLMTYLKMTKTEYEFVPFGDHQGGGSPKGKMPWIHAPNLLGDDKVGDSTIIIDALVKADPTKYDLDQHLSAQDIAIGRAFKVMVEESFYWATVHLRWMTDEKDTVTKPAFFPDYHWSVQSLLGWYLKRNIVAQLIGQGTGLLTDEEVTTKAKAELKSLSVFLGTKKYFLGNQISSYDATFYSFLVSTVQGEWNHPVCLASREYPNLVDYVERMQKEFWS